jgi:hypothetical protein
MAEDDDVRQAVEELHRPERLADLLVGHLRRDGAPRELVERAEQLRQGVAEWLDR